MHRGSILSARVPRRGVFARARGGLAAWAVCLTFAFAATTAARAQEPSAPAAKQDSLAVTPAQTPPAAESAQQTPPTTPAQDKATAKPTPVKPAATAAPSNAVSPAPAPAPGRSSAPQETRAPVIASPVAEPTNLRDLTAWLEYRRRNHLASLPHEARLFYRQGLLAQESGDHDAGVRLVRGASELDPSFVAPHLTLAAWTILREPSQSLLQYATVLELARGNFMLQLALIANAIYVGLQAIFLGILAAGILIVALHLPELRHPWQERLTLTLRPETARWWSWAFVILPYLTGFGPVLPTLWFLGLLWPLLRARERIVFLALLGCTVSAPWTTAALDRLATPLHQDRAPLFGVPLLESEPWSAESQDRIEQLATQHPNNPFVAFGLAWMQRRGGQLTAAEASYRRVLAQRPDDDRALNNLGNVLAMQGRSDEALELYLHATKVEPTNAAAYFNASQIYTQRYEYRSATEALARASALDFEMVKSYQSESSTDGMLALVDQWVAPATFWAAASQAAPQGAHRRALPPSWRNRIETSGWIFSALAFVVAVLGMIVGHRQQKISPLRTCGNCGTVVCRRCTQRRREVAHCPTCAQIEARAESPEFARVLLLQHSRRLDHAWHLARTAAATLIPGFGLLSFRRVFTPVLLLAITSAMLGGAIGMAPPFSYEPRLRLAEQQLPVPVAIALWALLYTVSIVRYFRLVTRERERAASLAAPVRSRTVQATRHNPATAA